MPSPAELQTRFAKAVLDPNRDVPAEVVSHLRPRPVKRFGVYRNNVYASLINAIEGRFPVVARLLGEEFFRATARVYVEQHPPVSPVLITYGGTFPDFLDRFEPVADVPYLGDVARLEWAWNEAFHAADVAPVGLGELQGVSPEYAAELRVHFHPSMRTVTSPFPIVTIWTANSECGEPQPIDAGAGGEDALVLRPHLGVDVRRLPPGGAAFIRSLAGGAVLGEAAAAGIEASAQFVLQENLVGLMQSGAIIALEPGASEERGTR